MINNNIIFKIILLSLMVTLIMKLSSDETKEDNNFNRYINVIQQLLLNLKHKGIIVVNNLRQLLAPYLNLKQTTNRKLVLNRPDYNRTTIFNHDLDILEYINTRVAKLINTNKTKKLNLNFEKAIRSGKKYNVKVTERNEIIEYIKDFIQSNRINLFISIFPETLKKFEWNKYYWYPNVRFQAFYKTNDITGTVMVTLSIAGKIISKDSIFLGPSNIGHQNIVFNVIRMNVTNWKPVKNTFPGRSDFHSKLESVNKSKQSFYKISYGDTEEQILLSDSIDSLLPDTFREGHISSYEDSSEVITSDNINMMLQHSRINL